MFGGVFQWDCDLLSLREGDCVGVVKGSLRGCR